MSVRQVNPTAVRGSETAHRRSGSAGISIQRCRL